MSRTGPESRARVIAAGSIVAGMMLLSACSAGAPAVEATRSFAPLKDYGSLMVSCMSEAGWEVSTDYSNSVFITDVAQGIPPQQADRYNSDLKACSGRYGFDKPRQPTEGQLEELYAAEQSARTCMIVLGYSIEEMPSLATFLDSYGTPDGWDLVAELDFNDPTEEMTAFSKCPPPAWFPNF